VNRSADLVEDEWYLAPRLHDHVAADADRARELAAELQAERLRRLVDLLRDGLREARALSVHRKEVGVDG
jgi:hypothetical protein